MRGCCCCCCCCCCWKPLEHVFSPFKILLRREAIDLLSLLKNFFLLKRRKEIFLKLYYDIKEEEGERERSNKIDWDVKEGCFKRRKKLGWRQEFERATLD